MPQSLFSEIKVRNDKTLEHLRGVLLGIRTGRAHPGLVEDLKVDYFGTPTPIKSMGSVSVPEARQILITPWDKTAIAAIEKAIHMSSLGINPQNDGESIRLSLPELTQQRRVDLVKIVNKEAEDSRISIRNTRRDVIESLKKMEKDGEITEDELKRYQKDVQDHTDSYVEKIDNMAANKEKEIMDI